MEDFFCFWPFIKHIAFRRMTASMLAFLYILLVILISGFSKVSRYGAIVSGINHLRNGC